MAGDSDADIGVSTGPDTETEAEAIVSRLLKDDGSRRVCLGVLADYMATAGTVGRNTWAVTLRHNLIRLNVGRIRALDILEGSIHLALDALSLTPGDTSHLKRHGRITGEKYETVDRYMRCHPSI